MAFRAGGLPGNLLIVANHISWLDIFVLQHVAAGTLRREGRVAPLAGRWLAVDNVGTVFVERERRRHTGTVNRDTAAALRARGRRRDLSRRHDDRRHDDAAVQGLAAAADRRRRRPRAADRDPLSRRRRRAQRRPGLRRRYELHGLVLECDGRAKTRRGNASRCRRSPARTRHRRELARAAEEAIRTVLACNGARLGT